MKSENETETENETQKKTDSSFFIWKISDFKLFECFEREASGKKEKKENVE